MRKELKRRNPGFDGMLRPTIDNGVVTALGFLAVQVDDIAPVRALKGLTSLKCGGTDADKGKLSDLSSLKGMPLTQLTITHCPQVRDLSPLEGMPLTHVVLDFCARVQDLEPLKGLPITRWQFEESRLGTCRRTRACR